MDNNLGNEIVEAQFSGITESMLPEIISGQVREIQSLEVSIKNAVEKAETAKALAVSAKEKSVGLFQKKEAIELLQNAAISLAEAESATVEAQTVSFACQKKIGEITKYLFALGCTNMAANRSVVRELKMILEGASGESLDELAKKEVISVIRQLKAQEDVMNKQVELSKALREQERRICEQASVSEENRNALVLYKEESRNAENRLAELNDRFLLAEKQIRRLKTAIKITLCSSVMSGAALIIAIIGLFL